MSGEARQGEPKQAGGSPGSCLQNLEGKLQLQGRLAGEEPSAEEHIAQPQTAKERQPISPSCCPLTSYQWFPMAEPSWNPEDREVHAREQSQAGGEGSGSGGQTEGIQTTLPPRREESYCTLFVHLARGRLTYCYSSSKKKYLWGFSGYKVVTLLKTGSCLFFSNAYIRHLIFMLHYFARVARAKDYRVA